MVTIRELRKAYGLSQQDLAVKLGVTVAMISRYETRTAEPGASTLRRMAKLFNVSMDAIAFEKESA